MSAGSNSFATGASFFQLLTCVTSGFSCGPLYTCVSEAPVGATVTAYFDDGCHTEGTQSPLAKLAISSGTNARIEAAQIVLVQTQRLQTVSSEHPTSSTSSSAGHVNSQEHNGLSTGVKAAIGTVIPLVAILAILLLYVLFRRRQRHLMKEKETVSNNDATHGESFVGVSPKAELDSNGNRDTFMSFGGTTNGGSELDATTSNARHSRGASVTMSELSVSTGGNRLSELPGSPGIAQQMSLGVSELPGDSAASVPANSPGIEKAARV